MKHGQIKSISSNLAWEFLRPRHYAGRRPSISKAFGWYIDDSLVAVCTFGKPASPYLCDGICGAEYSKSVYELNRLCRVEWLEYQLSEFVSACLNELKYNDWIIVSFSDTGMHHNGYIYQACNFYYTGATKERTDKYVPEGKHARHYKNSEQGEYRVLRTSKNRYVYFATRNKYTKKRMLEALNYPIQQYPKNPNKNYVLGEYQKQILVKVNQEE